MKNLLQPLTTMQSPTGYSSNEAFLEELLDLTNAALYVYVYCNTENLLTPPLLSPEDLHTAHASIKEKLNCTPDADALLPLIRLQKCFQLSDLQIYGLALAMLFELKEDYSRVFSSVGEKYKIPTLHLAKSIYEILVAAPSTTDLLTDFSDPYMSSFFETKQFIHNHFFDTVLILKKAIMAFILGKPSAYDSTPDAEGSFWLHIPQPSSSPVCDETLLHKITALLRQPTEKPCMINLFGPRGTGRKYHLEKVAFALNRNILWVKLPLFYSKDQTLLSLRLYALYREARLHDAFIAFLDLETYLEAGARDQRELILSSIFSFLQPHFNWLFVLSEKELLLSSKSNSSTWLYFGLPTLTHENRLALWHYYGKDLTFEEGINLDELTNKFLFTPLHIQKAVDSLKLIDQAHPITKEQLYTSCYEQIDNILSTKATLIDSRYSWEQLILPSFQKETMAHACDYIKFKHIIYTQWGFDKKYAYGTGLNILFSGPPGTGKTMAAQVIAKELGLKLYKVDLSQLVSKYIGETEANLRQIFDAAEKSNVILFIDEMDALFNKRSEVKSSHDRYSNMETSYLLQRIESYTGIVLLATNYLKNIDEAFMRRIHFIIHFPFPDATHRKMIWQTMFPPEAPLHSSIDFDYLANTFEISGGSIKNIVLNAAFLAAAEEKKISMKHLIHSLKAELMKQGKVILDSDFKDYIYYLH